MLSLPQFINFVSSWLTGESQPGLIHTDWQQPKPLSMSLQSKHESPTVILQADEEDDSSLSADGSVYSSTPAYTAAAGLFVSADKPLPMMAVVKRRLPLPRLFARQRASSGLMVRRFGNHVMMRADSSDGNDAYDPIVCGATERGTFAKPRRTRLTTTSSTARTRSSALL